MSIVITDAALADQLSRASGTVEVRDAKGRFLGTFATPFGKLPPDVRSPHSDEETEVLRKQPDGRPLADIHLDLEKGGAPIVVGVA